MTTHYLREGFKKKGKKVLEFSIKGGRLHLKKWNLFVEGSWRGGGSPRGKKKFLCISGWFRPCLKIKKKSMETDPKSGGTPPLQKYGINIFFISYMGSKKCFNAKKFFFLFFPEYLPLILGVPINVGVPNPNFRGTYPPKYHFFLFYFWTLP